MNSSSSALQNVNMPLATPRRTGRVVGLLTLLVATGHFNRIAITVVGTERLIPQGLISETRMGQIYSAFLLLYTLWMVPGGWLIDRFGARTCLTVFCFGSALFVAATSAAGYCVTAGVSLWIALLAVRALMGAINAPLHPAAARVVFEQADQNARSFSNGIVTFGACFGIAATYYGFGKLIDRFNWPTAFLICAGMTFLVGLIWTWGSHDLRERLPHRPVAQAAESQQAGLGELLRHPGVICVTGSYVALGYFQYLFFYWIQYYFGSVEKLDKDVARQYSTLITLTMGVGMVFGGWLADRLTTGLSSHRRRSLVPALGMAASGAVFELGLLTSNSHAMLAAFTISAALIGMCEGVFWTTAVELGGKRGGFAAGVMNLGGNAGGMLSPVATPFLSGFFGVQFGTSIGWRMSLAVAGVVPVIGALLWLGVHPRTRETEEQLVADDSDAARAPQP